MDDGWMDGWMNEFYLVQSITHMHNSKRCVHLKVGRDKFKPFKTPVEVGVFQDEVASK